MKRAILSIFIFLTTQISYGQREYLEPAKGFSQYQGVLKEYYDNIFPLLYNGFSDKPYARYTSMPSFSREYAFSVEQRNDGYFILSNSLSEDYWNAKNRSRVKAKTFSTEIDEELYKTIGDLFQFLAKHIRKHENKILGADGTTYYFATTDNSGKLKTGETWSPNDKSLMKSLVKICDNLYLTGQGNDISQTEIQVEIKHLIIDLEK